MEFSNQPIHKLRRGAVYSIASATGAAMGLAAGHQMGLPADADFWHHAVGDAVLAASVAAPALTAGILHGTAKLHDAVSKRQFKRR